MFKIPSWCVPMLPFFKVRGPTAAGVSGGRTSGMMHALTVAANTGSEDYIACFANTGREDGRTLRFVDRISSVAKPGVVMLEMVPPRPGAAPVNAGHKVVTLDTATRDGSVFESFLSMLASYRLAVKGLGPVAPFANMRICTAYMKTKVIASYVSEVYTDGYDYMVGLRADEPERVRRLISTSTSRVEFRCPLSEAGINSAMVRRFWSEQDFDLDMEEPYGNCSLCFLKDEADLATIMYERPGEAAEWIDLQSRYGDFRRGNTSMSTIFYEAPYRLEVIRPAVRAGIVPAMPDSFTPDPDWLGKAKSEAEASYQRRLEKYISDLSRPQPKKVERSDIEWARYRWDLIVRQEVRLHRGERSAFSCACESAQVAGIE